MDRYLKMRELAYEFAFCVPPSEFLNHWERHADILQGCRMVFSDPRLANPLPAGLDTRTFGTDPQAYLNGFFISSGLFFFSPELFHFHKHVGGVASPQLDYSVALDSNIIGDIHKFMSGKSLDSRWPAFLEMAAYLRRNRINLDATPYLFENLQKAIVNPKHLDFVINGFAAFYRFSTGSLLQDEPQALSDFKFEMNELEAKRYAEKTVAEMIGDPHLLEEDTRRLWHRLDSHYALLLTAIEYFGARYTSLEEKLDWMLRTLERDVQRIPEREFLFALLAFAAPEDHPFFSHQWPRPYNRSQNVVDLVRNMAWDMSFYRTMQSWASKTDRGDFAIPLFLTFDWKLAEMTDIYACRLMLLDDHGKNVFCYSPLDVRKLLEAFGVWETFQAYFSTERVVKRMTARTAYKDLAARCREAEEELHQIVYARPYGRTDSTALA